MATLASGIDVGQRINVGPGKYGKKDKRRALNTHIQCSNICHAEKRTNHNSTVLGTFFCVTDVR